MALYGLTCGYWTDDPEDLDRHLLEDHINADDVYDLFEDQAPKDVVLRQCEQKVT